MYLVVVAFHSMSFPFPSVAKTPENRFHDNIPVTYRINGEVVIADRSVNFCRGVRGVKVTFLGPRASYQSHRYISEKIM
jgi:hypothetical protein